ncbi:MULTISPECIES: hypothetical protein [unclassified Siphonobacter]|uniref:hypothetical protein n=1 Tax=unclassified Siphonobacter TaxID=2635712 RepID=UPI0011401512|nr:MULTISPECIES: hypothetical protein [unclassified Siphonobacter]
MKRVVYVLMLCGLGSLVQAQVLVNGVDLNTLKEGTMISIEIREPSILSSLSSRVDYGQKDQVSNRKMAIEDPETGKAKKFNSSMEVVNFMIDNGWEYQQAVFQQPKTVNDYYDYRYFFRKKSPSVSLDR